MHIIKSRNPFWLLLDIAITVWLWRVPIVIPAILFSLDSLMQLVYMFFPELITTYEYKKWFRVTYAVLLITALILILRHFAQ